MKPLNRIERRKAFYKVTGFFLVSLLIGLVLCSLTMKVPVFSEKNAKSELDAINNQLKFQKEIFAPNVHKADSLLNKVIATYKPDQIGINLDQVNNEVGLITTQTRSAINPKDEPWRVAMYSETINCIDYLHNAYKAKLKLSENLTQVQGADVELKTLKLDYRDLETRYNELLKKGSGGGGGGGGSPDCAGKLQECAKNLAAAKDKITELSLDMQAKDDEIKRLQRIKR